MTRREHVHAVAQWVGGGLLAGLVCGSASALFLFVLEQATDARLADEVIVFSLPVAGLIVGWLYERFGTSIMAGNNLVIDTIHDEGPEIPLRMAPMVLIGTVLTHLFGGSAGREGTAGRWRPVSPTRCRIASDSRSACDDSCWWRASLQASAPYLARRSLAPCSVLNSWCSGSSSTTP